MAYGDMLCVFSCLLSKDVKYSVQTLAPGALRGTLAHKYRTEGHLRGATENQQQGVVLILEQVTDENKLDAMLDHRLSTEVRHVTPNYQDY